MGAPAGQATTKLPTFNPNILFLARPNLLTDPGGDTIQILRTAEALRRQGLHVDVNPPTPDYRRYDLLHFFNLIDPEDILGHIRRTDQPFVVSTIYVDYREYDRYHRRDLIGLANRLLPYNTVEYFKTVGKWLLRGESLSSPEFLWRGHRGAIRHILKKAAHLLPNSENEYRRLLADYPRSVRGKPYTVVPNAVDPDRFYPQPTGERDAVLCISRIEGRKNHLNLIRALEGTNIPLVFVGAPAKNQPEYYRKCKQAAGDSVRFEGFVPNDRLGPYYLRARVHVLPSWFETTGLTSLEAAAMGCNIVVGDRGDVRDYFGPNAWYCEPGDPTSIRNAVLAAWHTPPDPAFAERVRREYNWEIAARMTIDAYQKVLLCTVD